MDRVSKTVAREDAELIDGALRGDSAAFGDLVFRYQDRLFNAVYYVVRSREEAEDVVQEAFVLAYTKLQSFQRESQFYTWLYRIAFNTAATRRRRRRPESSTDQARELTGREPVDTAESPQERLERSERAGQLQEALDTLSEQHRAILVLREMEDRNYDEIAEILELPIGTVRSRLHRARLQLRDQLQETLQEHRK
jgi:RNA polymerase sigma-70 factor (ECF subfamily)